MPDAFIVWSSNTGQWLEPQDVARQVMWGASRLVGVDGATEADGALLLHAGCRVSAWQHEAWGPTTALPAWCGLDAEAGVFAFNRLGDYVGLNWGGQPGQWGAYRRRDNTLLKGAPGIGSSQAGDYVTGIASDAFADAHTQLRLAGDGHALAVTANDYSQLPSADDAAGRRDGATGHLWATWLK